MSAVARATIVAAAVVASFGGCGDDAQRASGKRERVQAVQARASDRTTATEMCDVMHPAGAGPALTLPALTTDAPPHAAGTWQWINVWATWCKPCIEEMPRLSAWRGRLANAGARVVLQLVSADESDEVVAAYRADHPATPATFRLADPDGLAAWVESLGVPGASLPVHVFVDPRGQIRCVRASAVEDTDYPAIESLLRGG
jgi:thiol-disulfide isomerase/thioredoxin